MATHSLDVPPPGPKRPSLAEFERIYTAEFAFVWRVLRRFGVQREQLEDAAQDVFLVWVRRGAELGRGASVRTCLYGIARRVAADARRSAARSLRRREALAAEIDDRDDSVERTLETQQALTVVDRALQQLSEVQREAYWLAEVEGLSAQQIGAALQISPNTVSSRVRLARQRLAAALGAGRPLPAREEPPVESRARVWAVLLPLWDAGLDAASATATATATAGSAPYVLSATLSAALALLALMPSGAPPAAPSNDPGDMTAAPSAVAGAGLPSAAPQDMPESPAAPVAGLPSAAPEDMPESPAAAAGTGRPAAREDMFSAPSAAPRAIDGARGSAPGAAAAPSAPLAMNALERLLRRPATPSASRDVPRDTTANTGARATARPTSSEDPLAREARQIGRAQRLLADDRIDEALAALDAHAAATPYGRLADEREALRAAARCRRGERDAGLAAAERWFAGRPDAPALATARARCNPQTNFAAEKIE